MHESGATAIASGTWQKALLVGWWQVVATLLQGSSVGCPSAGAGLDRRCSGSKKGPGILRVSMVCEYSLILSGPYWLTNELTEVSLMVSNVTPSDRSAKMQLSSAQLSSAPLRSALLRSARRLSICLMPALLIAACEYESDEDSIASRDRDSIATYDEFEVASARESPVEDFELDHGEWEYAGQVPQIAPTPEQLEAAANVANEGSDAELFEGGYEAMLVLADGTAFGRIGGPTDVPEVSVEESVGIPADYDATAAALEMQQAEWILEHADELIAHASPEDRGAVYGFAAPGDTPDPLPVLLGGDDNRSLVSSSSTLTSYPWRTVGNVLYNTTSTNAGGCTATKIGPRHAITAAHCLHDCDGTWYSPIWFAPGQQGDTWKNGGPRKMVARYARTCANSSDYGLLILEDSSSFASLGWVGYGWWNNLSSYQGKTVWVRGYPQYNQTCAASPRGDNKCGGYMYSHIRNLPSVTHTNGYVYHSSDTSGGQSGSSLIYFLQNGDPITLGVHKRGNEPSSGATITSSPATYNIAPRMRSSMWNDICTWIGNFPSSYASHPCQ